MPTDSNGAAALTPYNVSLASISPIFLYKPVRDTDAENGWNATYTGGSAPTDTIPTDRSPARVTYRRTQAAESYIALTFEGAGVYLCISARGAAYTLTVDGASVESSAPASGDRACDHARGNADTLLYARGLAYGAHSVRLDVTAAAANREFRFFGGALEIGVQTGGKAVNDSTLVDDLSPSGWTLVPGRGKNMWDTFTDDSRFLSRTLTFNCIYDETYTATYTFSGAGGAVLIGGIWPHAHGLSVQLDDAPPVNLDATAGSFATSAPFFLAGALDPAVEHRITVRDFNSDMPNCTFYACCALVDAVQLLRAAADDLDLPRVVPLQTSQLDADMIAHLRSAQVDPSSSTQPESPGSNPTSSAYPEPPRKPGTGVIAGSVGGAVLALVLIAPHDRFPHVLFDDIMDFLDLEELLLSVLPVNRLWRALTIEHRTYWRDIRLEPDRDSAAYISLFRARLSRSSNRLVNVTIRLSGPQHVLPDIGKHLAHIRELDIQTNMEHASAALSILRTYPAPRLRLLRLCFEFLGTQRQNYQRYATLPSDLFACHAPELASLDLRNVEFPSSNAVPACLARLSHLMYYCVDSGAARSVPPQLCRRLHGLSLCMPTALDDVAYQDGSTWRLLRELVLYGYILEPSALERLWTVLRLPVTDIPCIRLHGADAAGQYALAESLDGPLCLTVPRPELWFCKGRIETCLTEAMPADAERQRWAIYDLPAAMPAPESNAVTALGDSRLGGRVTRLVIARAKWYDLVGAGYLASLPRLDELVLELCDEPPYYNWRSERALFCPRLRSVCMSAALGDGMALDAEDLAVFAESGFAGIAFPIALSLQNVHFCGDKTRVEHLFSSRY